MPLLSIRCPFTRLSLGAVPTDNEASIHTKFAAARLAQRKWAAQSLPTRLACVERFRDAVVEETPELARLLTQETGKPVTQSRNELRGFLDRIDFFLATTPRVLRAETVARIATTPKSKLIEQITHEPLGVIANISAWNYPYFVGGNVFIPALLTGNAVLYKPSEFATLTGLEITRMLHQSGVPREVFAPIVGGGEVGRYLLDQPINAAFFTGSYATGVHIARQLAGRLIPLQLELGGKDPAYVCDDANVAVAAASLADGAFYNTGQSCCAVERIYVHETVHDAFVATFVKEVARFRIGDPLHETTYIGPLTRPTQLDVLAEQIADAVRLGGKVVLGGGRPKRRGNYFSPTVIVGANHRMKLMREESFGPVIGIMAVRDDEEAVKLMADTEYGLTAGVYSTNATRARRILGAVSSGTAYWNCCDRVSPRLPWSGTGHSGLGVTLSHYGVRTFTRPRAWHLRLA